MSEQDAEILKKLELIQDNVEKLKKASKLIMADYKRKLLSSNLASTSSYLNIDSDGYSVSRDFIQIYNGSFLTCPSLTIMGSFVLLENKYFFVDAEKKVRGILKIEEDNILECIVEPGKWSHFVAEDKLHLKGHVDSQKIVHLDRETICGWGKNEHQEDSTLYIKAYSRYSFQELDESQIFVISFFCRKNIIPQLE